MLGNRNLFIIGTTKTGKTTLSRMVSEKVISMSQWVKETFQPTNPDNYLEEITRYSQDKLASNPDACVDFVKATYHIQDGGFVIEGARNPRDFALLFRPGKDLVVRLYYTESVQPSGFESDGLAAIDTYLEWLIKYGLMPKVDLLPIKLDALFGQSGPCYRKDQIKGPEDAIPCWNLDEAKMFIEVLLEGYQDSSQQNHCGVNIPPFEALVASRVMHNDDPSIKTWEPCKVFGVTSYPGHTLTFQILLGNGSVFSYVPLHRLCHHETEEWPLEDLVYHNCPDAAIAVTAYQELKGSCKAFFHKRNEWVGGTYMFTIDWYQDNNLLHLIALDNDKYALLPSHKVLFSDGTEFPKYQKLRVEWKV